MAKWLDVLLEKVHTNGQIPGVSKPGDAGFDLACAEGGIIWPFCARDFPIGWRIKIPVGFWGSIKTRSSTLLKRRIIVNEGVYDSGYTGELYVSAFNPTFWPKRVQIGDRLAQLIVIPQVGNVRMTRIAHGEMPKTHRGQAGSGSTGE